MHAAMQPTTLVLRDIHPPVAPPWWPPAPGWWMLAAALLVVLAVFVLWLRRDRRRRVSIERAFDEAVAAAGTPAARVATVSELLRRAARRREAQADRLQGDAWLGFLDGAAGGPRATSTDDGVRGPFSDGPGRLLLDGGFRREVDETEVAALLPIARRRYRQLMGLRG